MLVEEMYFLRRTIHAQFLKQDGKPPGLYLTSRDLAPLQPFPVRQIDGAVPGDDGSGGFYPEMPQRVADRHRLRPVEVQQGVVQVEQDGLDHVGHILL